MNPRSWVVGVGQSKAVWEQQRLARCSAVRDQQTSCAPGLDLLRRGHRLLAETRLSGVVAAMVIAFFTFLPFA
jgi:hypothetical protein